MARGFTAGFGAGAVICGAGLVVLSLSLPVERPAPTLDQDPAAAPVATGPEVDAIEVPAGSEFARGVDEAPVSPAALAPARVNAVGDAPAVVLPADEAGPRQGGDNDPRPETRVEAPDAPAIAPPQPDTIDLPAIPAPPAPIPVDPPGRVEVPGLDRLPDSPAPAEPRPRISDETAPPAADAVTGAPDAPPAAAPADEVPAPAPTVEAPELPAPVVPAPEPEPKPDPEPEPATPKRATPAPDAPTQPETPATTTPALPAPGLDLSTPPDLGDLRLLDRN